MNHWRREGKYFFLKELMALVWCREDQTLCVEMIIMGRSRYVIELLVTCASHQGDKGNITCLLLFRCGEETQFLWKNRKELCMLLLIGVWFQDIIFSSLGISFGHLICLFKTTPILFKTFAFALFECQSQRVVKHQNFGNSPINMRASLFRVNYSLIH